MSGVAVGLVVISMAAFAFGVTRYLERERRRRLLSRFAGRERIPFRLQICSALHGDSSSEIEDGWRAISSILNIDPDLLRPTDRLDGVLGEDSQFPVESEFHDLCEEIARCKAFLRNGEDINTLWGAAQIIGKAGNSTVSATI